VVVSTAELKGRLLVPGMACPLGRPGRKQEFDAGLPIVSSFVRQMRRRNAHFFNIASRLGLNSAPGFHSGYLAPFAT